MVNEIYQFRESDAYDFARHAGAKTRKRGNELEFESCPYCKGRGIGNVYTFAIDLKTGQFNCMRSSCNVRGNMITLSKDFGFSLGKYADEYYTKRQQFRRFKKPEKPFEATPTAIAYLENRKISKETIQKYQITTKKDDDSILIFPFFGETGDLELIKYRNTNYKSKADGNKEWFEQQCRPILFGMYQCNLDNPRLIITEGQIDSLSLSEAGIENAVSVQGGANNFRWIPQCWDWLSRFEEIIVFGDFEKGHMTLLDEIATRMPMRVKQIREEDYCGCKDANEILQKYGKDQLRKCVENAEYVPIKQLKDLSDVTNVDIYALEKLPTGIKKLDAMLRGGLPFGGLTILSGKAGEGKSTLGSQILSRAVYSNQICFAYSGELPDFQFKSWIDFQIAGSKHVFDYQTKYGEEGFSITQEDRERISNWYKGKIYIFDNSIVEEEETKSLLDVMELSIKRYGVRVLLVDNLMTALDLDADEHSDRFERQSLFVKKLARLALKYNVLIILVAHKRKNGFGGSEMDNVMGSSDITNLASITIAYGRGTKKDGIRDEQRMLKLVKNRLFGITNFDGWAMDFDPKSKRIFFDKSEQDFDYEWEKSFEGFVGVEAETEDAPF